MSIYSKILVVANINSDEQPALARAVQLAQKVYPEAESLFSIHL